MLTGEVPKNGAEGIWPGCGDRWDASGPVGDRCDASGAIGGLLDIASVLKNSFFGLAAPICIDAAGVAGVP